MTLKELNERITAFGIRVSDGMKKWGSSWTFILSFVFVLVCWVFLNSWWLMHPFDKYPYVFLNLLLSMLAAIQAPVIMMSQNRQEAAQQKQAELDRAREAREAERNARHDEHVAVMMEAGHDVLLDHHSKLISIEAKIDSIISKTDNAEQKEL